MSEVFGLAINQADDDVAAIAALLDAILERLQ